MASPALNNSKLILKEQRKLLTRKKSMEFFCEHVLIITKGKAARRRKQKRDWWVDHVLLCIGFYVFVSLSAWQYLLIFICLYELEVETRIRNPEISLNHKL